LFGSYANSLAEYCDATTKRCVPRVAVGKSCRAEGIECVLYAECDGADCVAQVGTGQECVASERDDNCLGDLECTGGKCTMPVATACK
jgi:hypothetical protein